MESKMATSVEQLCAGLPGEFAQYLKYCRNLQFPEAPNYEFCRQLFRELFNKMKYALDYQYDWVTKKSES